MEKINLNIVRGFSDSITTTFNLLKQEFVPFIKSFAILALPVVFIDLFFKSFFSWEIYSLSFDGQASSTYFRTVGLSYLSTILVFFWIQLEVIAYIRVYWDKYQHRDEAPVTAGEVWQVMQRNIGKVLGASILYGLIVLVGLVFMIIPGIYFALALLFIPYLLILKDQSFEDSFSGSMGMVKGQWWNLFGYVFVLQLIISMLAYAFNIPYMILLFKAAFTGEIPGTYEITFGMLLASLGQHIMQTLLVIGVSIRFFSISESREHTTLLSKIDQLGDHQEKEVKEYDSRDEGEY